MTEHVEGDPCKFALWVGRTPTSDNKIVLKVSTNNVNREDKGTVLVFAFTLTKNTIKNQSLQEL